MNIFLASTSPYRARLLGSLRLPFVQVDPEYRETAIEGEKPEAKACRLAEGKARAVATQDPDTPFIIIGSDQVASVNGQGLGKPGGFEAAFAQLKASSGQWVTFDTAICLLTDDGQCRTAVERFEIRFRGLSDADITRYLNLDEPFDCAGSIRAESLGIALIDDTRGRDFNTLLGLPLMLLVEMLESIGLDLLNEINY